MKHEVTGSTLDNPIVIASTNQAKVFLVLENDWESGVVRYVTTTREAAERFLHYRHPKFLDEAHTTERWAIEEWPVCD